jgi:hypothetical protein
MSGFKDDVLAILRDNVMLHGEAMGLIMNGAVDDDSRELLKDLQNRKFPVTDRVDKHVFLFDYIVLPRYLSTAAALLRALSLVGRLSVIIMDISNVADYYNSRYTTQFGDFTANKVKYQDRTYLVIKNGTDYGN